MRALGHYIVRGRMQAVGVVAFSALASLLLPPFAYLLSGVPLALLSLRRGAVPSLEVIAGSLLLVGILSVLFGLNYLFVLGFALAIWLPVYLCAIVLRQTESQGMMLMMAGGLGLLFALIMHFMLGDVSAWWQAWLERWLGDNLPADAAAQYRDMFAAVVPMMNALMAAGLVISLVLTTLLGRWWQSRLFNPGGFRAEFYHLGLPSWLLFPTVLAIGALFVADEAVAALLRDGLFIIVFLYLFQGLASVHRIVHARRMSHLWLVFMYGLLFILPQMALLLACVGMADAWSRWGNKGGKNRL